MNRKSFISALVILALGIATLACGGGISSGERLVFPTATPNSTQTPNLIIQQITTTPNATQTPNVVVVSATPNSTNSLCVSALVAVHLRPSPSTDNYPISVILNGTELVDLGGRSGDWIFVALGEQQGWVYNKYVGFC